MSLKRIAELDLENATDLYNKYVNSSNQDYKLLLCYHVEQCVEKCIKYCIEHTGNEYAHTHDIHNLCNDLLNYYSNYTKTSIENQIEQYINNDILPYATMLTVWESKSRYDISFTEVDKNIILSFSFCNDLLKFCTQLDNCYGPIE